VSSSKEQVYKFARYVRGRRMAEGITINRAATLEQAGEMAANMADARDVLIYCEDDEIERLRDALRMVTHSLDCARPFFDPQLGLPAVDYRLRVAKDLLAGVSVEKEDISQAPIAKVTVWDHLPPSVEMYTPGLPAGEHDLYCEPPDHRGQKGPHPFFDIKKANELLCEADGHQFGIPVRECVRCHVQHVVWRSELPSETRGSTP
jgi:hypothetical protein